MVVHPLILLRLLVAYFFGGPAVPSFTAQLIDDKVAIGYGLAIGDVNGDRKPDILLADKKQFVWYRNGDWKRFVMAENLTESDNVCIAARDLDGDGRVEVAVGAQWNPGETADAARSGSVHYLVRPGNPEQPWRAITLHHEPTVHRMQWVRMGADGYALVVAPLHGRGNKGGSGAGAKLLAYHYPAKGTGPWRIDTLEQSMHLTHNFDVVETPGLTTIILGGKEGVRLINPGQPLLDTAPLWPAQSRGVGEVRASRNKGPRMLAAIEPMHGDELVVYLNDGARRVVVDNTLKEGHGLALADLGSDGREWIVAGWRNPNAEGKVGVKVYQPLDDQKTSWQSAWVDDNGMACEDLKVADLNGDGKPDIIAAGRATHNLKIYWQQ